MDSLNETESEFKKTSHFRSLMREYSGKVVVMSGEPRPILNFLESRVSSTMAERVRKSAAFFEVFYEQSYLSSSLVVVLRDGKTLTMGVLPEEGKRAKRVMATALFVFLPSVISFVNGNPFAALYGVAVGSIITTVAWKYMDSDQNWMQAVVTETLANHLKVRNENARP